MTAAGGQEKDQGDPALAELGDEFTDWVFDRWRSAVGEVIRGRRKPVTALSEWVLRPGPDEVRAEIRHREQHPPGG